MRGEKHSLAGWWEGWREALVNMGCWLLAWEGRTRSNVTAFLAGAGGWSQKGLGGNWDDLPVEKGTRGSAELYHS